MLVNTFIFCIAYAVTIMTFWIQADFYSCHTIYKMKQKHRSKKYLQEQSGSPSQGTPQFLICRQIRLSSQGYNMDICVLYTHALQICGQSKKLNQIQDTSF